jgi:hypothetical protein
MVDTMWKTFFLNAAMLLLQPLYVTVYGACLFSTRAVHHTLGGFNEHLAICEDCEYVDRGASSRQVTARYRCVARAVDAATPSSSTTETMARNVAVAMLESPVCWLSTRGCA